MAAKRHVQDGETFTAEGEEQDETASLGRHGDWSWHPERSDTKVNYTPVYSRIPRIGPVI